MTFEDFDKIQAKLLLEVAGMGSTKGKEYANSVSRFANFDRAAEKNGVSRLVVANIFLTKHMDAIDSFIKNGKIFSTEGIHGRIVDAITYLTLIDGMIREDGCRVVYETSAGEAKFSCGTHDGGFNPSCSHCVMLMESLEKRGKIGVKNANT